MPETTAPTFRGILLSDIFFVAVVCGGLPIAMLVDTVLGETTLGVGVLAAIFLPLVIGFAWATRAEFRALDARPKSGGDDE